MDLVSSFNPPRLCHLAGQPYWVRATTLGDFAQLAAWLDDVIPGRDGRKVPPRLNSEDADKALDSLNGRAVQVFVALRDQDVTWSHAREIAGTAEPYEWYRFLQVRHSQRRTRTATEDSGSDLGESWCGPVLKRLAEEYRFGPDVVAGMTLDQIECYASEGIEREDPRHQDTQRRLEELDRLARANAAKANGNGKADHESN